jgi:hypothetical protein
MGTIIKVSSSYKLIMLFFCNAQGCITVEECDATAVAYCSYAYKLNKQPRRNGAVSLSTKLMRKLFLLINTLIRRLEIAQVTIVA